VAKLIVGKSLDDTNVLWRYISLDKFIDLVATKTLFFAPLDWYARSDPFEGYLPSVAMDVFASISRSYRDEHLRLVEDLFSTMPAPGCVEFQKMRDNIERQVPQMRELFKNVIGCLMVNCWYRSDHESEGMWGLYSKDGVAIRTSVGAVRAAFDNRDQTPVVHLGTVKYLDFADKNLVLSDCITDDGNLMGMVKRIAYSHEREVRMYINGDRRPDDLTLHKPVSIRAAVDVRTLLEAVVVSPLAGGAMEDAVRAICRWGEIDERVVSKSKLLDNCEYLLDVYP
jgi:hypothetical protein